MRRETVWCKHYRAMSEHKTCEAGVAYEDFKGVPFDKRPCFHDCDTVDCEHRAYPTAEERAAEKAYFEKRIQDTGKARQSIVAHLGLPWKRGTPGASGVIDCPVCDGKECLHFSRSGVNGHIHARCTTEGCVAWME